MVNANIESFEMSYEESVFFKRLENLENIKRINGPNPSSLPVDNKKRISATNSVGKSSKNHEVSNMWCHYCDKNNHNTDDFRAIAKLNTRKRLSLKPKMDLERILRPSLFFSKKFIYLKGN
jgi:hypothetical protein